MASSFVPSGSLFHRLKSLGLWWCTAERATLAGMLLVVLPVTTRLFPVLAPAVVPSTLLVTVGYWLWAQRLRSEPLLVLYAIFVGAAAGCMNAVGSLHLYLWVSGKFEELPIAALASLPFGVVGCLYGVPYGLALFPPLWVVRRSRRFHAAEAMDRVLASTGLWGLITLGVADQLVDDLALNPGALGGPFDSLMLPMTELWILAALGCLLMFAIGVARLRQRRAWLARVAEGNVPGWLVVSSEQFKGELDELPVFCPQLFGQAVSSGLAAGLVLAEGAASKGAYRSERLTPRFRLA